MGSAAGAGSVEVAPIVGMPFTLSDIRTAAKPASFSIAGAKPSTGWDLYLDPPTSASLDRGDFTLQASRRFCFVGLTLAIRRPFAMSG